ncbi:FAD/NAD(P)-binding protein [Kitasatospora viridis]|uniref:Glutamate mutase subunit E n=1 Tax=Kitasatospora viridis TaxID=281105 RepID=A0A561UCN5_9ACTN|nr:FAD/NAD(P)-binding protein [Kitasatospora viridis]TWF97144.1 glutamate mutase subunit E [Kitasatospora viridis]
MNRPGTRTHRPAAPAGHPDLHDYVMRAARAGELVVQPRMGMSHPEAMAAGLGAVAAARARTLATMTIDSYTRVEDIAGAQAALSAGEPLNGFPIVNLPAPLTARVAAAAGSVPVQVRHGSARPGHVFRAMIGAGLAASEGGPVSYCLPYSRLPLTESVPAWADASRELVAGAAALGARAHLETFGGCMLGQLCPPSLLIALSLLEAMFFVQNGLTSISLSYAQQTNAVQDIEALAALRDLAADHLPPAVDRHLVLYTYMGVHPRTEGGARLLLEDSARIAVRGGAHRLIVKTAAEAHRIPTVAENVAALERAAGAAAAAHGERCRLPWAHQVDHTAVHGEARSLIEAVLELSPDVGTALRRAFAAGLLDVPFCLHRDNAGAAQGTIREDGRLVWGRTGALPLGRSAAQAAPVTSAELLNLLNRTADRYDNAALGALLRSPGPDAPRPYRIAIVGSGPRGLAVAERLAARLAQHPPRQEVSISLVDKVQVGSGRVWRTTQDECFLMNTACGEVTMYSGPAQGGRARAGAGPTLAEWWAEEEPDYPGPGGYASRALYGRYLQSFLDAIESSLPPAAQLQRVVGEVVSIERLGDCYELVFDDGRRLTADRVVLSTGHPVPELSGHQAALDAFATGRPWTRYVRGDSAADMPLAGIAPDRSVAVLGMGLSFYDVAAALTTGRGGRFEEDGRGSLTYLPSGREPRLIAGSRSGVPMPARGRNQKSPQWRYTARLFTAPRIAALRESGPLDFRSEVWPWLDAEMQLVYHATAVRLLCGTAAERAFTDRVVRQVERTGAPAAELARAEAQRLGAHPPALDVAALARPFAGRRFAGPEEFTPALVKLLEDDVAQAELGNHSGPLKAALDVLRDVRGTIRRAVDHGGLTAASHEEFLTRFVPMSSFLAAGPPIVRLRQTRALIEAGVLDVVGPAARFDTDPATGSFTIASDQVSESLRHCDLLIDARVPEADLARDRAPLSRQLASGGVVTEWANTHGRRPLRTGGIRVTAATHHPVGADGTPDTGLYVLGIPTEGQRWFMQVGSTRPGPWTEFTKDADAIAADALTGPAATAPDAGASRPRVAGALLLLQGAR